MAGRALISLRQKRSQSRYVFFCTFPWHSSNKKSISASCEFIVFKLSIFKRFFLLWYHIFVVKKCENHGREMYRLYFLNYIDYYSYLFCMEICLHLCYVIKDQIILYKTVKINYLCLQQTTLKFTTVFLILTKAPVSYERKSYISIFYCIASCNKFISC